MEVSNEPADDPFPKTTSKGSFAPTEIKGNDDTLKISTLISASTTATTSKIHYNCTKIADSLEQHDPNDSC
ncbi:hypothetical protein CDAR_424391 [Caerostris darwini]|uniref:Uncharacterized protein n=1 Tax=Caerostris darwini TaxID=1538125 RepID=A0AAV4T8A9_9ARAC|nr:hypothetical protein CDAR_424391 [Caerostris darwini]